MWIAETASHRPFQDHELSMSRHIPEREHLGQRGQEPPLGTELEIAGEGGGDVDPLTPTMAAVGEIGRTPIPVAESTHHPRERPLTPVTKRERERLDEKDEFLTPAQSQGGITGEARGDHWGGEPEWALPKSSDPHRSPRGGTGNEEVPLWDTERRGESPPNRNAPSLTNN